MTKKAYDNIAGGLTETLEHVNNKTRVRKKSGSAWHGRIVGFYSTSLTPIGYAVESEREPGSVQIYPASAVEVIPDDR